MLKPLNSYFVALEVDGVPKFSSNPKPHKDRMSASSEAERLAKKHLGKTFGIYVRANDASSTFKFEPKFTVNDLLKNAEPGVYQPDSLALRAVRLVVTEFGGERSVTFMAPGRIEPVRPQFWNGVTFTKRDERAVVIKNAL